MAPRDELLFTIRMTLRKVPLGIWRVLGKPHHGAGDELPERIAAETILEHREQSRWRLEHSPPPPGGPGLHSKIR
jgi:hypothetical protein